MQSANCDLVGFAAYQILQAHLERPYQSLNSEFSPENTSMSLNRAKRPNTSGIFFKKTPTNENTSSCRELSTSGKPWNGNSKNYPHCAFKK